MTEKEHRDKRGFNVLNSLRNLDLFGEGVGFSIAGNQSVPSCAGAIMTILITVVSLVYAWTRFEVMLNYSDTRF